MEQKLKFWGWGYEGQGLDEQYIRQVETLAKALFGIAELPRLTPPTLASLELRSPRCQVPETLKSVCSTDKYDRALHSYGQSFYDAVRKLNNDFSNPPDVVAYPKSEQDIVDLYAWAADEGVTIIPFGGGTSVVGGVEPPQSDRPVVAMNLRRFDRVLEVDEQSLAARIQGGIYGPDLEAQLKPMGYTLRFFPQSFEFSTLGGWIATRAGGHFVMGPTHIDDLVESVRVVTPKGIIESRRLPGSGAGPSPDRMMIGSEGILGVITEAWVRIRRRTTRKWSASIHFSDYDAALEAVKDIAQSGLMPSNCRLLDAREAMLNGIAAGDCSVLVLAFESCGECCEDRFRQALNIAENAGGLPSIDVSAGDAKQGNESAESVGSKDEELATVGEDSSEQWKQSFLKMPYLREYLCARGIINETFETAMTWERLPEFIRSVRRATIEAIKEVTGRTGFVSCRLTHVYADGAAPYFTFLAYGDPERMIEQCEAIKTAAANRLIELGGTITHHHAVGRDHRPWYDQQRPDLFAQSLQAVKAQLDPDAILNPGVLIDP
ncbi:FAD-binding oxidoreductase [Aestuariirhabdus sp. Z084]|uniref:FAD-binding oxidoreductase n=1 Tax=Aestuariirhabdus haliotis TaxID=2918751 RepID=UPI00201B4594|nr:FAD-binding oxidoreductase [Aestuariirhabdus haliotis]MCL6416170.1 FAD-binding oxidoreductase [Aestuariirhabdus haliotis]MCL6420222.1 FAD-binding oxidoreductase [Aestuariirhabdus haliotis]